MLTVNTRIVYTCPGVRSLRRAATDIRRAALDPMFLGATMDVPVPMMDKSDWLCWVRP